MKQCSRCLEIRSLDQFYKNRAYGDGLNLACKSCTKIGSHKTYTKSPRGQRAATKRSENDFGGLLKRCTKCKEPKTLDSFAKNAHRKDGLNGFCRVCDSIIQRLRYTNTPNKYLYGRKKMLQHNYGLTVKRYEEIFKTQGGACAICLKPETAMHRGKIKLLAVDHDHKTGQIRGLLCGGCNLGLGKFGDDVVVLTAAIRYLNVRPAFALDDFADSYGCNAVQSRHFCLGVGLI